ncbi:MAG: hypothetical protein KF746_27850 [Chitinophagaceae bacterium]|nr:hypothetical protein [Chitinophagaceae bacterium]
MTREKKYLLITIAVSLVLSFLHCPWYEIFFDDKEIFKYTGLVIHKGGVPYRDFFDHKPPLIYFFNYAGLLLGGNWGLWIIDTTLVLFATIVFFRLCNRYSIKYAWILPVLFNLMIRDKAVSFGVGMTRAYTAIFILLFVCVMLGNSRYRNWLLGILSALVFFMQQDQVLVLLPFLAYAVFTGNVDWKTLLKKYLQLSAGFLIIAILVLGYFIYHHALAYFWEDAFVFNFTWYNHSYSFIENAKSVRNFMHLTTYEMTFYVSIIAGCFSLLYGNSKRLLLVAALMSVLLSFSAAFLSGKLIEGLGIVYYFLPLAVTVPLLLFVVFSGDKRVWFVQLKQQALFTVILFINLVLGTMQYALHLPVPPRYTVPKPFELQYMAEKRLKDYQLYAAFNANKVYLYNELKILAPSKWIYHFFWVWFDGWDADLKIIRSITADLRKHQTLYILDYSDSSFEFTNQQVYDYWKQFLKEYYEPEETVQQLYESGKLWRLKEAKE